MAVEAVCTIDAGTADANHVQGKLLQDPHMRSELAPAFPDSQAAHRRKDMVRHLFMSGAAVPEELRKPLTLISVFDEAPLATDPDPKVLRQRTSVIWPQPPP